MKEHLNTKNVGIGVAALAVVCAGFLAWPGKPDNASPESSPNRMVLANAPDDDPVSTPKVAPDSHPGQASVDRERERTAHQPDIVRKKNPRDPGGRITRTPEVVPAG